MFQNLFVVKIVTHSAALVGKPAERDHSEDKDVDGKIILECILGKYGNKVWSGCI
jgi:hypothetical protein